MDLLSYSITDLIPFSREGFQRLTTLYNARFTSFVLIGQSLGVAALVLLWRRDTWRIRLALAGFALIWLWISWAYHVQALAPLLWAGELLAIAFAMQSGLLLAAAVLPPIRVDSPCPPVAYQRVGYGLLLFAVALQPLLGLAADRAWGGLSWFGSAPDPTAVATLGLAWLLRTRLTLLLTPIPLLWCLVSLLLQLGLDDPLWIVPALAVAIVGFVTAVRLFRALVATHR